MKHEVGPPMLRSQTTRCDRFIEKKVEGANETRRGGASGANETRDFVAFAVQTGVQSANKTRGRE